MLTNLKFLFLSVVVLLNANLLLAISPEDISFQDQLKVAIARQKAGVDFDAPLNKSAWLPIFEQNTRLSKAVLDKDDKASPERKAELHAMLGLVNKKGHALFESGEMDTYWNLFLHQLLASLMSNVQSDKDGLEFCSGKGVVCYGVLEHFDIALKHFEEERYLRKNHLEDVRAHVVRCRELKIRENFSYTHKESGEQNSLYLSQIEGSMILTMDCFYLPFVGPPEKVLFPVEDLCESLVYRVGAAGIPTERTPYDGNLPATARRFMSHDWEAHLSYLFAGIPGKVINRFSPDEDPLLNIMHPLWQKIMAHESQGERMLGILTFFYGFHEAGYEAANNWFVDDIEEEVLSPETHFAALRKRVKTQPMKWAGPFKYAAKPFDVFYKEFCRGEGDVSKAGDGERRVHNYIVARVYGFYREILESGMLVEAHWRTAEGAPLGLEAFPRADVLKYLDDVLAPLLLKIQWDGE